MEAHVCDVCKKNYADERFKVKQEKTLGSYEYGIVFPKKSWVEIDICDKCYEQLIKISRQGEENV